MVNKKNSVIQIIILFLAILFLIACNKTNQHETNTQHIIPTVTKEPIDNTKYIELDSILCRTTYLDGISIDEIDISGKTIQEARELLEKHIDELKNNYIITLVNKEETFVLTQKLIPIEDNLDSILKEANSIIRRNTGYDSVMQEVKQIKENGKNYTIQLYFDPDILKTEIDKYAATIDIEPKNAFVGYDKEQNKIIYIEDISGQYVNKDELISAIQQANTGDTIEINILEQAAEIKLSDISNMYVLRGEANTSFKGSTSNRKYNIKKGAGLITGTILKPGEIFSCNETLGVRNKKNGWKNAGAYEGGETVQQAGGGVCQLSSTLYNAVLKADLEIVERRNHSMKVSYIDQGLDATINSVGNIIDFKFKNNTDGNIIIISYTNENKVYFEIYGKPFATDEYDTIKLRSKKIKTISHSKDEITVDKSKPAGYYEEVRKARNGSVWKSYKMYYKNDKLVKEEELDISTYKAYSAIIIKGPEPTPAPTDE